MEFAQSQHWKLKIIRARARTRTKAFKEASYNTIE
jgi:hypothetical protein